MPLYGHCLHLHNSYLSCTAQLSTASLACRRPRPNYRVHRQSYHIFVVRATIRGGELQRYPETAYAAAVATADISFCAVNYLLCAVGLIAKKNPAATCAAGYAYRFRLSKSGIVSDVVVELRYVDRMLALAQKVFGEVVGQLPEENTRSSSRSRGAGRAG